MNFNDHSNLVGKHALFSPSKPYWLNYSSSKAIEVYINSLAAQRGTDLHKFACDCIRLGQPLPQENKTLNMYVNDAIGFKMRPELILFYSYTFFGTADALSFRKKFLRIHDLKTGEGPVHMEQLLIYAALFCLEYKLSPSDIDTELRIYQADQCIVEEPEPETISEVMHTIVTFDDLINKTSMEV